MNEEKWSAIPGSRFNNLYEISTKGRVRNKKKGKFLDIHEGRSVNLITNGQYRSWKIHVLMGCTFLGNDIDDEYRNRVLFKDKDPNNLNLENLYIEDTSDLPGEIWKDIVMYHGRKVKPFYQISNMGRVKSLKHDVVQKRSTGTQICRRDPEIIVSQTETKGYVASWLAADEGPDFNAEVHQLVAYAFCENDDPENKIEVNHIDGNKLNNCACNLEWVTRSRNMRHAYENGLASGVREKSHRPVMRLETGHLYPSFSHASRAMGRDPGYVSEHVKYGKPCLDIEGQLWTFKELPEETISLTKKVNPCTIEEFPGKVFDNLSEASKAIGRWVGYIADAMKSGTVIKNKAGQVMHVHLL